MKVLCLDIEGGHGGSSRSLYYLLKHMDPARVRPSVWLRRNGQIEALYRDLSIPAEVVPRLPKASALPRASRNLLLMARHIRDIVRDRDVLHRLADEAASHDVVHFNHEGFAGLGYLLSRRTKTPITFHIRTNVVESAFARLQMRLISCASRAVAFITSNEERTFRALGGTAPGEVIFNVVDPAPLLGGSERPATDGMMQIASLSNASHVRGTDRLLEIAAELSRRNVHNVRFLVAGDMKLDAAMQRTSACRGAQTLEEAVGNAGLQSYFQFLGHVPDPERVLAAADLLIKPTRENNPWGRDIIEAMVMGKPVLSIGADQTFVEPEKTGLLFPAYDVGRIAEEIAELAQHRERCRAMGALARARVEVLCHGPSRAADLASLWERAARMSPRST